MTKANPKTVGDAKEGAAQVAAASVTRKRAPRKKKASQSSQSSGAATSQSSTTRGTKRKRNATASNKPTELDTSSTRARAAPRATPRQRIEKRAKPYIDEPPESFTLRMERLRYERHFILGHTVTGANYNPVISFDIVGSTGNMYKTVIRKVPTCDCPDARFRRAQCKHIFYALVHALKAPANLQYQAAFLSSELREIWEASPLHRVELVSTENEDGRRKPIEGDCPICFMEFEPNEEIEWCKAACGNNVHKQCFAKWAETGNQNPVRCVYCRTEWNTGDNTNEAERLRRGGFIGFNGYVNVGHQLGYF